MADTPVATEEIPTNDEGGGSTDPQDCRQRTLAAAAAASAPAAAAAPCHFSTFETTLQPKNGIDNQ